MKNLHNNNKKIYTRVLHHFHARKNASFSPGLAGLSFFRSSSHSPLQPCYKVLTSFGRPHFLLLVCQNVFLLFLCPSFAVPSIASPTSLPCYFLLFDCPSLIVSSLQSTFKVAQDPCGSRMANRVVQGTQFKPVGCEMSASWAYQCPQDEYFWYIL